MGQTPNPEPRMESLEPRQVMTTHPLLTSLPPVEVQLEWQSDQITGYGSSAVDYAHDQLGLDGYGQTVAVIDSGIAYDHEALGGGWGQSHRVVGGWDFAENDADPYDDRPGGFHGTHVAGILASDDARYTGVAPGADLVALRVFDDSGSGHFGWVEEALAWVHTNRDAFEFPITTVNLSLGADWHDTRLPDWAMLEDELAQLEQAGIFVAVAAGNSFQDHSTVGLSYPAVSSFVVPVASVGADGNLSPFSQRDTRALLGPGERVVSTVPDYLYGFDGVTDDYAVSSGTSMATPYVAGASMLVRQAWERAGRTQITQDALYEHLRDTADPVFDPVTRSVYRRVNLERALEEALPHDDHGDAAELATVLGTLQVRTSLDGTFHHTDDKDYFTFTAGRTGQVRWEAVGGVTPNVRVLGPTVQDASQSFAVVAGEPYMIQLSPDEELGAYSLTFSLTAVEQDLGMVDAATWNAQPGSSETLITAAHDGRLTVALDTGHGGLELWTRDGELVAQAARGHAALTVQAQRGDTFRVRIVDWDTPATARITNLVQISGDRVSVQATSERDRIVVRTGTDTASLTVNGATYLLPSTGTTQIAIQGASATDEVWLFGTAGNDLAGGTPDVAWMEHGGQRVEVRGVPQVSLIGGEGHDAVWLEDSVSDDRVTGRQAFVVREGGGSRHFASGFESMTVSAGRGRDQLQLHGDGGAELHLGIPSAVAQWETARLEANGFATIVALAGPQMGDRVHFDASAMAASRFVARPNWASLEGAGARVVASGFSVVAAAAPSGGNHEAILYDSAGNDQLVSSPDATTLKGVGFSLEVRGFGDVAALARAGGSDSALLQDSAGDDVLWAFPNATVLHTESARWLAQGFEHVTAIASAGADAATFFAGSTGDNAFDRSGIMSSLRGTGFVSSAAGFEQVHVHGIPGTSPQGGTPAPIPSNGSQPQIAYGEAYVSADADWQHRWRIAARDQRSTNTVWDGWGTDPSRHANGASPEASPTATQDEGQLDAWHARPRHARATDRSADELHSAKSTGQDEFAANERIFGAWDDAAGGP